jgi:hypothetical protein
MAHTMPDEMASGGPHETSPVASSQVSRSIEQVPGTEIAKLEDRIGRAEKLMIWFTGAIAFCSVLSVLVAYNQWSAMKGQWSVMKDQLGEMRDGSKDTHVLAEAAAKQATNTEKIAQAAKSQSETANRALEQTKVAVEINREALVSVQRAFVVFRQAPAMNALTEANSVTNWEFQPVLENTGLTPTRGLRQQFNSLVTPFVMKTDFAFPDVNLGYSPFVIGPKESVNGAVTAASAIDIALVKSHQRHLYLWGWAMYRDVFERTPVHVSMFCAELTDVRGDPTKNLNSQFTWTLCHYHNCTDHDCDGEKGDPRVKRRQ